MHSCTSCRDSSILSAAKRFSVVKAASLVLNRCDDFVPLELLVGRKMDAAFCGDDAASQDVIGAFQLRREILVEQPPPLLGRPLDGVARRLIHGGCRSLDNHLLAGAYQARAFLPDAGESGIELLFGLDASGEVTAQRHRRDTIAVDDAVKLRNGLLKSSP